jgi:hypothetical protein
VIDQAASKDPVWAEKRLMRRYPDMIIANRAENKISVDQPIVIEWRTYNEDKDASSSSGTDGDSAK